MDSSSLFFTLPLPLGQPLLTTRLAAFAFSKVNQQGNVLDQKIILNKRAPHTKLSPTYLFQQNIPLESLDNGLKGLEFYQACRQNLCPATPDDTLVTFALRHLTILNGVALQNLEVFNFLRQFNRCVELKTAIATCHYFGQQKTPLVKNLKQAATVFEYKGELKTPNDKLNALTYIYGALMQREPKIMSFLLRTKEQLAASISNANSPYFVHVDDAGRLCLIKILSISNDGAYLKALCAHTGSVDLIVINLEFMPLIAPLSILTPERQERLNFNVNEYIQRLDQVDLKDFISEAELANAPQDEVINAQSPLLQIKDSDRSFYERFILQFKTAEECAIFYRQPGTPLSAEEISKLSSLPAEIQRLMVFYQFENFPEQSSPELIELYNNLVSEQDRSRTNAIYQECTMLRDNMASYSEDDMKYLNKLFDFFLNK